MKIDCVKNDFDNGTLIVVIKDFNANDYVRLLEMSFYKKDICVIEKESIKQDLISEN